MYARAQAQKELELRNQLMATVQKDHKITDESWAILGQLNKMKETEGKASDPLGENEEKNLQTCQAADENMPQN